MSSTQNWGWNSIDKILEPIRCDPPAAPESLLKVITCKCKITFRNACGTIICTCLKNCLKCVPALGECRGLSCNNPKVEILTFDESEEEEFSNIFDI